MELNKFQYICYELEAPERLRIPSRWYIIGIFLNKGFGLERIDRYDRNVDIYVKNRLDDNFLTKLEEEGFEVKNDYISYITTP